jgi:expansin
MDVALSHVEYGTADACGGYLDIDGPDGSVRVLITNQCPECQVGHIDLSKQAFDRIGPLAAGQISVSYTLVRNPPLTQTIALRVKSGSSRWWMQIQPLDHGNPIASFELQTGSGWRSLVHTDDNFWMAENPGPGDGPFTVRITDIFGQTVTVDGVALAVDQVQRTGARLYDGGAAEPAPPPTEPPTTAEPTTAPPTTAAPTTAAPTTAAPATPPASRPGSRAGAGAELASARSEAGGPGTGSTAVAVATLAVLAAGAAALRRHLARTHR